MKALVIEKPGVVIMKDVAVPEVPEGFVRVKVKAAAICATDLEVIDGNIKIDYPITPGHEWSGIADAAGSPSDSHWIGKRVIGSNDVVCLKCEACRRGDWRYCDDFEEIGFMRNGAYAEYVIVPAYGLYELPDNISFKHGALIEPLGVALGTLEKLNAQFCETLLIMGAGSIGLCMLAAGKAMGLKKIVVCASSHNRLEIAEKMGAYATIATSEQDILKIMPEIHPKGSDIVIDATGNEECIRNGIKLTRKGGKFALAGYSRNRMMSIKIDDIQSKNLHVAGSGHNWNMLKKGLSLMEDGSVNLECFITETMKLDDFEHGIELARKRPVNFVKAMFIFN